MKGIVPVVLSALMIGLISCGPEEIIFDPSSDVFMVTKTVTNNGEIDTLYGLALHVLANKSIQSVIVTPDDGSGISYELSAYGFDYDFFYQTADADFSTSVPYLGAYSFDIIAKSNESSKMSDKLLDDFIYPTDTLKSSYDGSNKKTKLNWNKIKDADYIIVKLFNTNKDMLFSSDVIKGTNTEYSFGTSTTGWINGQLPVVGTNYLVEMDAYMYEPGQTGINIQSKSISFKEITWGE